MSSEKIEEKDKKKKKSLMKKLTSKFASLKKQPEESDLLVETVSELKSVVKDLKEIFDDIDHSLDEKIENELSFWQKVQTKLPKAFQSEDLKQKTQQKSKIKTNKEKLTDLEETLDRFESFAKMGNTDMLAEEYLRLVEKEGGNQELSEELEKALDELKLEIYKSIEDMNSQIKLLKTTLDVITEQLAEQGVQLDRIEEKVDVVDQKLNKTQELIKKISKKLTSNNILIFLLAGSVISLLVISVLK